MRLTDLIKQKTNTAEVPKVEEVEEKEETSIPNKEVKSKEIPADVLKQYETVGEVHASMFSFCVESPLHAFNGIYTKIKKRKLKKKYDSKDDKEILDKETEKLMETYEANKKVIDIEDSEYRHLKNAFTSLAKQNKTAETNAGIMIATAVIGILVRRVEILMD